MSRQKIIQGTLIYTISGIICRIAGFIFRIFLSRIITAEEIGLYQLVMPIEMLANAICVGGISTAVIKYVAGYNSQNKKYRAYMHFLSAFAMSLFLSILVCITIKSNSRAIAIYILKQPDASLIIHYCALTIPFACIHIMISGFFIGLERPMAPAFSQVFEQAVRIGSTYLFYNIAWQNPTTYPLSDASGFISRASLPMKGTLAGEIGSALFMMLALIFLDDNTKKGAKDLIRGPIYYVGTFLTEITCNLKLAWPISINKICLHLIHSLEAFLLPLMLMSYGMSSSESLTHYGILSGMTMPLLFFPATFINSLAVSLLPDISKAWDSNNKTHFEKSLQLSVSTTLYFGFLCLPGFYFYGADFGAILFDNVLVSTYTKSLCLLCPFLFLSSTLTSILNGIEKTQSILLYNMSTSVLRLAGIVFFVPRYGITAYFAATILCQSIMALLMLNRIKKETDCHLSPMELTLIPGAKVTVCFLISYLIYIPIKHFTAKSIISLLIGAIIFAVLCFIVLAAKILPKKH